MQQEHRATSSRQRKLNDPGPESSRKIIESWLSQISPSPSISTKKHAIQSSSPTASPLLSREHRRKRSQPVSFGKHSPTPTKKLRRSPLTSIQANMMQQASGNGCLVRSAGARLMSKADQRFSGLWYPTVKRKFLHYRVSNDSRYRVLDIESQATRQSC